MDVPVRLYRRTRDSAIVEVLEPGESGTLLYGQGAALVESVAESSGVADYLRKRRSRAEMLVKAVEQAEVEDKSVDQGEVEDKSITLQERSRQRRSGGG
jgi:hypothetical protein